MPMYDGYRTLITFTNLGNANFNEVTVKPPGVTGRGPIDTTSMRNNKFTTKWPKSLIDFSSVTSTAQWDPRFLFDIIDLVVNKNQTIRVQMPNNQKIRFYGWADRAEPNEHREGEVPLITLELIPSNVNPQGVESAPVLE